MVSLNKQDSPASVLPTNRTINTYTFDVLANNQFRTDFQKGLIPNQDNPSAKAFVSSKDLLDGEWVQFHGDGKAIDGSVVTLNQLLRYD